MRLEHVVGVGQAKGGSTWLKGVLQADRKIISIPRENKAFMVTSNLTDIDKAARIDASKKNIDQKIVSIKAAQLFPHWVAPHNMRRAGTFAYVTLRDPGKALFSMYIFKKHYLWESFSEFAIRWLTLTEDRNSCWLKVANKYYRGSIRTVLCQMFNNRSKNILEEIDTKANARCAPHKRIFINHHMNPGAAGFEWITSLLRYAVALGDKLLVLRFNPEDASSSHKKKIMSALYDHIGTTSPFTLEFFTNYSSHKRQKFRTFVNLNTEKFVSRYVNGGMLDYFARMGTSQNAMELAENICA